MLTTFHDAVCIRQWDWSETSQTVSLFTRDIGMVRGLAKGSRRPTMMFSGGIEPLTRGRAGIVFRKNSELALITEWDLTQTFRSLRTDLGAHHAGLYCADLTNQFVRDHDAHEKLFDALVEVLGALEPRASVWPMVAAYQWSLLTEAGYRPMIDRDARTGEALREAATLNFEAQSGGLVNTPAEREGVWRVRMGTIEYLRGLERRLQDDGREGNDSGSAEVRAWPGCGKSVEELQTAERAARLLGAYVRHILGFEPPTHATLFGQGA